MALTEEILEEVLKREITKNLAPPKKDWGRLVTVSIAVGSVLLGIASLYFLPRSDAEEFHEKQQIEYKMEQRMFRAEMKEEHKELKQLIKEAHK